MKSKAIIYIVTAICATLFMGCDDRHVPDIDKGSDKVELLLKPAVSARATRKEPIITTGDNFQPFPRQDYYERDGLGTFDFGLFVCDPSSGGSEPYKLPDWKQYDKDLIKLSMQPLDLVPDDYNCEEEEGSYIPLRNDYNNIIGIYQQKARDSNEWGWQYNHINFKRNKIYLRKNKPASIFAYYPYVAIASPKEEAYENPRWVPVLSGYTDYLVAKPVTISEEATKAGKTEAVLEFTHVFTCIQVNMYAKYQVGDANGGRIMLVSMTLNDSKKRLSRGGFMDVTKFEENSNLPVIKYVYHKCNKTDRITSKNIVPIIIGCVKDKDGATEEPSRIFIAMPQPEYIKVDGKEYEGDMTLSFEYTVNNPGFNPEDPKIYKGRSTFTIPRKIKNKKTGKEEKIRFVPGQRYIFNIVVDNSLEFAPISNDDCWIEEEPIKVVI